MATDNGGNLYILSVINTQGFPTISGVSNGIGGWGGVDALLTSYTCGGAFRWKKVIGGGNDDNPTAIGVDTLGHVYLTGGAVQPQSGTFIHFDTDSIQPANNIKVFYLIQYDTLGNFKWLRQPTPDTINNFGGQFNFSPTDMVVGKNGDVEIFTSLGKGRLANSNMVVDSLAMYILQFDVQGNITGLVKPDIYWNLAQTNGMAKPFFYSFRMAKTPTGRNIIAGTQTFYTFPPYTDPMAIGGQPVTSSMFVACFNSNWNFLWKRENSAPNSNGVTARPAVDGEGNIYVSANGKPGDVFNGYVVTNNIGTSGGPLLIAMDSAGNLKFGKVGNVNAGTTGYGVAVSGSKVYLAGAFPGTVKFDNLQLINPPNTGYDIFLAGFDKETGATLSLDSLKGPAGFHDYSSAMTSDNRGNVYVGGRLGASFQVGSTLIQSAGGTSDFFVAKFGSANCNTPMPLTLTSFTAALQNNNQVLCRWQTRQEYNTKEFIIQRSADGANFSNIGTVKASGNSNVVQSYSFIDPTPVPNSPLTTHHSLFYRLQMLDLDGSYTYSSIAKINLSAGKALQVYPNPASGNVGISYKIAGNGSIEVYNSIGIKIQATTLSSNSGTFQISTASWPNGIYNIILRENGKAIKSTQLIVVAP